MKRFTLQTVFVGIMVTAGIVGAMAATGFATATGTSGGDFSVPSCSLPTGPNITIVTFPQKKLISTGTYEEGYVRASTNLPKGTYKITAVSFDGYAGRSKVSQPSESYSIGFESGAQSTWQWSKGTWDIADYVEQDTKVTPVESSFVLKNDISTIRAQHVTFNVNGSPNSVYPVCASFERLDAPAPAPAPAPTTNVTFDTAQCPFTPSQNTIVVAFPATRLIGGSSTTQVSTQATIPSGNYSVDYYSYDGYSNRNTSNANEQKTEQWYLDAFSSPRDIQTFGPTPDLADYVNFADAKGTFSGTLTSTGGSYTLTARHATPNTQYNSVVPSCVAFTKIAPPPAQTPYCTISMSPTSLIKGNSGTLSWTSQNAVSATIDNSVGTVAISGSKTVTPQSSTTYTLTVKNSDGVSATCSAPVTVTNPVPPQDFTPSCPLIPQAGRTIVEFKNGSAFVKLVGGQAGSPTTQSEYVSIPAGDYAITTYSYDGYPDRASSPISEQNNEQWYLDIFNGVGAKIKTFGPTTDLTDGVKEASATDVLTTSTTIGEPIATITARHATPNAKYNSVYPVCVAFDLKQTSGPSCPLVPTSDTTVVEFGNSIIRSDLALSSAVVGPKSVSLASGLYDVTLASYDDHTHKVGQAQPNEKWYVEFSDGKTSNAIADLPDSQDYLTQKVNSSLALGSVSSVKAVHAAYPDSSSPNSIVPICAAFKKLPDAPKAPTCAVNVNPTSIAEGGSATLSWTTTNVASATIDSGVGQVPVNGSKVVSPNQTTTYTGTFVGTSGAVITCSAKLTVVPTPDPICSMSITPTSIVKGGLATLSWNTSNVVSGSINQGVGVVPVNGTFGVTPISNTTYIGTFIGKNGKTVTCSAQIEVTPPPVTPVCPISPAPGLQIVPITTNIITANSSEANATVGPFALNLSKGSYRVYLASFDDHTNKPAQVQPQEQWELVMRSITGQTIVTTSAIKDLPDAQDYLVELVNSNLTVNTDVKTALAVHAAYPNSNPNSIVPICAAFERLPDPKDPVCTLSGFPGSITKGGEALLTWTSSDAISAVLDNNIGTINVQGSKTVKPDTTTTYTATFYGEAGKTVTCQTTIVVEPTPDPYCTLSASPASLKTGESTTLVWTSLNTVSATLTDVGGIPLNGSTSVSPQTTKTYTATFLGKEGKTISCSTTVTVSAKPAPVCTLSVNPTSITQGGVATLVWTTEHASSVSVNNGIGSVPANGSQSVSPAQNTTYKATVVGTDGSTIYCEASLVVVPPPTVPTCPLVGGAGKILIDFGDGIIRSDQTKANSEKGPVGTEIPSGVYKVTLASFDDHTNKPGQTQPQEQWYLALARLGGFIDLGTTGTIADLPDNQNYLSQVVNERFTLNQTATLATAVHAVYPNNNPNSVVPLCALFEKVEDLQKAKISGCVYEDVNKDKIKDGSDKAIPSVTVSLTGTTASGASVTKTTTTGADGCYLFDELEQGTYTVIESQPQGYEDWFDQIGTKGGNDSVNDVFSNIVLLPGDHSERNNFGEVKIIPDPLCQLSLDKDVIKLGESVTLSWNGTNVVSVNIDNTIGSVGASGSRALSPSVSTTYTGTFVGENGKTITCSDSIVVTKETTPVCPLSPSAGVVVVDISTAKIRSDQTEAASMTSPVSVTLAKGTYKVTLASFDNHTDRTIVTEPKEQWYLSLRDILGANVVNTATSPDLPDVKDYDVNVVNSTLVVSSDVKTVKAVHAAYPDTSFSNDIVPLCAAFEKLPEPEDPVCNISANPSTINKGDSATITWTSTNALGASMNQSIGAIDLNGSKTVSPIVTTTYTGTFVGNGGKSVTCSATVTVTTPQDPPFCTLSATPTDLAKAGDSATLTWTTLRASSVTIDNGIGAVSQNDSTTVNPSVTKTYTLTAVGPTGLTVTCSKTITVPQKVPSCEMSLSPNSVVQGKGTEVTLSWNAVNVTEGNITPDIGKVSPVGSVSFVPNDSKVYTAEFTGTLGTTTCSARVDVTAPPCTNCGGGGGGFNPPRVTIASTSTPPTGTPPEEQPLAFVYLSQVPYTGFEAGPLLTFFFWLTVLVITGIMTHYLIVRQNLHRFVRMAFVYFNKRMDERENVAMSATRKEYVNEHVNDYAKENQERMPESFADAQMRQRVPEQVPTRYEHASTLRVASVPANLPITEEKMTHATPPSSLNWKPEAIADQYLEGVLEKVAYESDVLISQEGLTQIVAFADGNEGRARMILEEMILAAKKLYPREDGWIPLNRERIQALRVATRDIDGVRDARERVRDSEIAQDVPASLTVENIVTETADDYIKEKAYTEQNTHTEETEQKRNEELSRGEYGSRVREQVRQEYTSPRSEGSHFSLQSERNGIGERASLERAPQRGYNSELASMGRSMASAEASVAHLESDRSNHQKNTISGGVTTLSAIVTFIEWIIEGKEEKAFNFLRKLSSEGFDSQNFLMQVLSELDEVFKNRVEGGRRGNPDILHLTSHWSNGELEQVIEILSDGADYSYSRSQTGAKIAIAKAVDYLEKRRGDRMREGR